MAAGHTLVSREPAGDRHGYRSPPEPGQAPEDLPNQDIRNLMQLNVRFRPIFPPWSHW